MNSIEDFDLPKAVITRIIRSAIPPNALLQKESTLALTRAATVFINYLTSTAVDISRQNQLKTITTTSVTNALQEMGFEEFIPSIAAGLEEYKKEHKKKKASNVTTPPTVTETQEGDGVEKVVEDEDRDIAEEEGDLDIVEGDHDLAEGDHDIAEEEHDIMEEEHDIMEEEHDIVEEEDEEIEKAEDLSDDSPVEKAKENEVDMEEEDKNNS